MSEAVDQWSIYSTEQPDQRRSGGSAYIWSQYASVLLFTGGMLLLAQGAHLFAIPEVVQQQEQPIVEEKVQEEIKPIVVSSEPSSSSKILDGHRQLADKLMQRFSGSHYFHDFEAQAKPGQVEVKFGSSDLFTLGRATLMPAGEQELLNFAHEVFKVARDQEIQIEGFTDSAPVVKNAWLYPTNWELSGARAASVLRTFQEVGFSEQNLRFVGYGKTHAIADNEDKDGNPLPTNQARNRRLVIRIGHRTGW
ncbi:MAG: OmpA family protein [Bdellovibrionaceae bacterium]|nr:OmpA family protein [Bdellovibrionales bacterium]MCB9084409.1 OmpA family protein [Pseudobdellovibrionaceae bacterium]